MRTHTSFLGWPTYQREGHQCSSCGSSASLFSAHCLRNALFSAWPVPTASSCWQEALKEQGLSRSISPSPESPYPLSLSLSLSFSLSSLSLSLSLSLGLSVFSLSLYIYIIPLLPSSFPPLSSTVVTKSTPNRVTAPGFAQTCACCVDMLRHGQRLLQYRLPCGACFKVGFFLTARWNCWKIFEPLLTPEIVAALRSFIS